MMALQLPGLIAYLSAQANRSLSDACGEETFDLWLYRSQTIALLRRYGRTSVELGRLPSILGREFFRSRVTSRAMSSFEDVVVFVTDMEHTLEELPLASRQMLALYVLDEYSPAEIAGRLGCSERTAERLVHESIDRFTHGLLTKGLMGRFGS